jgi:hypothetical protein
MAHSNCYILKLHGDYMDARILNTEDELGTYPKKYRALLNRIFDEHGLVIAGWSGEWDAALRAALLRHPNRRYPTYWTTRGAPRERARDLIEHLGARPIEIVGAEEFFLALQEKVATLEKTRRQNPASVDLQVETAKRYLSKSEDRIHLDALFAGEVGKALGALDDDEFAPSQRWDQSAFRERIANYESITEPLARMLGVLGRWGDGKELPLVLDIIQSLWMQAEKIGKGLTIYLNVRSYPAVLAFTAYGLGLARAGRWQVLHRLFVSTIAREYKEDRRAVEVLFLWAWKGTESNAWKQMEGLENRKTPLSDHLLELFSEWGTSFVGVVPDFELLFERYELLGSMAFLERHNKKDLESELAQEAGRSRAWMPVGRIGWHERNGDRLVTEIEKGSFRSAVLDAGFANGDGTFLDLFIANFKRFALAMRW